MEDLCSVRQIRVIETTFESDIYSTFLKAAYEQTKNTVNNAFWFLEGNDSNLILFHLFSNRKTGDVEYVICNLGSDIFDCIKLNTSVFATGGYVIESNGVKTVNPELDTFKEDLTINILELYRKEFNKYRLEAYQINKALDLEFKAEAHYVSMVDWIFNKIEITTTFKYFMDGLNNYAGDIRKNKVEDFNYLPYLPNFDPLINDSFLKAFGINPTTLIERYTVSKEELEYYKIKEKEVNWVYAFNAEFCGFWNAFIDSIEGLYLLLPGLYEILTDRANLKSFIRLIISIFEKFSKIKDIITQYDYENSNGSIYRYCYQQSYEVAMILSLLLPLPKAAKGITAPSTFEFFSTALAQLSLKSELLLLAYRLGLRIERTADEWALISEKATLFKGTKEKVLKRIEHIAEVTKKNPKFVLKNLSLKRLENLIKIKKAEGLLLRGLTKEEILIVQKRLRSANIAVVKFKVSYKGKVINIELKAYSGHTIKELNNSGFAKTANIRSGEKLTQFEEITEKGLTRRFQDTESKLFREFEDSHLKKVINQLGVKSVNELKIEAELLTLLDPCNVCQGQMNVFQAKYNAKINIYSSGANNTQKLIELYPKFK
ncbi:hypothetical protein LZQ00_12320 [Sphingobacterium sp. SRCM116780]|uniref:hypothetical protein n=1 Tax=Sphingobacterium sp. SRCM116780 TaxID=2907623 RepID=UPI001F2FA72C|nr:hypothetical protein [Sphingobacterium sp. SRCM116780]UIR55064.1 hypothetical protein LZQ00_12320 [Sphingobacterium sp. SRCM116780]